MEAVGGGTGFTLAGAFPWRCEPCAVKDRCGPRGIDAPLIGPHAAWLAAILRRLASVLRGADVGAPQTWVAVGARAGTNDDGLDRSSEYEESGWVVNHTQGLLEDEQVKGHEGPTMTAYIGRVSTKSAADVNRTQGLLEGALQPEEHERYTCSRMTGAGTVSSQEEVYQRKSVGSASESVNQSQ